MALYSVNVATADGGGGIGFDSMLGAKAILDEMVSISKEMESIVANVPLKHSGPVGLNNISETITDIKNKLTLFRDTCVEEMKALKQIDSDVKAFK